MIRTQPIEVFLRSTLLFLINQCFPLKLVRAKGYTTSKLWLSKALLKSIWRKHVLCKRFFNNLILQREYRYKCYESKLSHSLRTAKRQYYAKKIEEAKNNVKCSWRLLNEVLNKRTSKLTLPSLFKFDNKDLSDPRQIAEQFCIYFTNIGPSLARNIPASHKSHRHFHSVDFIGSLYFDEISEHEQSIFVALQALRKLQASIIFTQVLSKKLLLQFAVL